MTAKRTTARPGRNHYDTWNADTRVEYGPAINTYGGGIERDVYVNGQKIGKVERVMKHARHDFRKDIVDGWLPRAAFDGRNAEKFKIRLLRNTLTEATAELVNTYLGN